MADETAIATDGMQPRGGCLYDNVVSGQPGPASPVDIRFSLPLLRWRFFLCLKAGPERRAPRRLASERALHPICTVANLAFVVGGALACYLVFLMGFLLYASVLSP